MSRSYEVLSAITIGDRCFEPGDILRLGGPDGHVPDTWTPTPRERATARPGGGALLPTDFEDHLGNRWKATTRTPRHMAALDPHKQSPIVGHIAAGRVRPIVGVTGSGRPIPFTEEELLRAHSEIARLTQQLDALQEGVGKLEGEAGA